MVFEGWEMHVAKLPGTRHVQKFPIIVQNFEPNYHIQFKVW